MQLVSPTLLDFFLVVFFPQVRLEGCSGAWVLVYFGVFFEVWRRKREGNILLLKPYDIFSLPESSGLGCLRAGLCSQFDYCGDLLWVMSSQACFPHLFSMESNADCIKAVIMKSIVWARKPHSTESWKSDSSAFQHRIGSRRLQYIEVLMFHKCFHLV